MRFRDHLRRPTGLEPVVQWGLDFFDVGPRDRLCWYGVSLMFLWVIVSVVAMFTVHLARWPLTWGREYVSGRIMVTRRCRSCGVLTAYTYREVCARCYWDGRFADAGRNTP